MLEEFIWAQKYRPRLVADCILPKELKETFQKFVDDKNVPNLLLSGSHGVGKTTAALAMLAEIGADSIIINGSLSGNIDTLRNDIKSFASTVSFTGGRKYVILDEADYLNPSSTQPALRNFMEEYSSNCGFIMTCNFKNRIIAPLQSRCSVIDFKIPPSEAGKLAMGFMKRVLTILDSEGVEYEEPVVAAFITKHFPDWRRVLNELQRYSSSGKIDSGILTALEDTSIGELVDKMRAKDYTAVRKWIAEHPDVDHVTMFRKLYDQAATLMLPGSIPQLVLILGEYQYKAQFVVDQEINTAACLAQVMVECSWKDK